MIVPPGQRVPASLKQQLRDEFNWPPKPPPHVPGLPPPQPPAERLTIKQAMGSEPLPK